MTVRELKVTLSEYRITGEFEVDDLPIRLVKDKKLDDQGLVFQEVTDDHLFIAHDEEGEYYFGIEWFQEEEEDA
jgi:hypothetical protein